MKTIPDASAAGSVVSLPRAITEPLQRRWTEAEAFDFCRRLTRSHYENFPVGSFLIPRALQPAVQSLYAFMRTADDFSDENRAAGDDSERLAYLNAWDAMLAENKPEHPIFIALRATLNRHELPVQWLRDLLGAFKMDCTVRRYETFDDVLNYCRYSANPVGRLILTLFGYRAEQLYQLSDAICTGLQLANHWQDAAIDLAKDRIYLPQEDLRRFGVEEESLSAFSRPGEEQTENFRRLMAFQVRRTREFFAAGQPLPDRVRGRLRWELRMTWHGGVRILDKIEAANYDIFRRRPVVTKADWLQIAVLVILRIGATR